MSVLIKGMKLPENGYLAIVPTGEVFISGNGWGFQSYGWSVQPDGQAVELPDHGDLIDREYAVGSACSGRIRALPTTEDGEDWIRVEEVRQSLKSVPVVIPAERSEE